MRTDCCPKFILEWIKSIMVVESAIIPVPPTSARHIRTICPARVRSCPTETTLRPFTQEADVAMKSASKKESPLCELKGMSKRIVPTVIKSKKPATG